MVSKAVTFICVCDRFIGQQPDGILLDPEDSFWCQALEDLETCGQSELLREIEVSTSKKTVIDMAGHDLTWKAVGRRGQLFDSQSWMHEN